MQTYIVKCPETGKAFVEEFDASAPEKQIADFIASSTVISSQQKHGFDCRGFKNLQFFTDDHAYSKGRRINAKVYEFLCQREYGDIVFTQHGENCQPRGMERQIAESLAAKINEDPEAVRKSIIKEAEDAADAEGEITMDLRERCRIFSSAYESQGVFIEKRQEDDANKRSANIGHRVDGRCKDQ